MKSLKFPWIGLGIISILAIVIGVFSLGTNSKKTASPDVNNTNASTLQSFTNKSLKFSLQYPSTWFKDEAQPTQSDIILSENFKDPKRLKELEISDCLINESFNWTNNTPVKEDCTTRLKDVTAAERQTLNTKISPRDIYIKVIQPEKEVADLHQWLVDRFRSPQSEIEAFETTGEITMGGVKGYIAPLGCCDNYDTAYFVLKGNLIYQLGTHYAEGDRPSGQNALLDEVAATFKFL